MVKKRVIKSYLDKGGYDQKWEFIDIKSNKMEKFSNILILFI